MNNVKYTALAGKTASNSKLKVISNNAANASTPGFKADDVLFQKWLHYDCNKENSMPVDVKSITNHVQGNLQQTNNKVDFAVIGTGFLQLLIPVAIASLLRMVNLLQILKGFCRI